MDQSPQHEGMGPSPSPPPPPPPRLIVDRAPDIPALISVDSTSMSVQWSPVSITVKSTQLRVVECLEAYALEMQQVEVDAATAQPEIRDERWSVQYSGPATYVQVKGLRPGRNYAVRVVCRPIVTDPEVIVEPAPPSEILLVRTPATPPSAPAAPTLAVRQRNSLKYKWPEPAENGGHPILAYVVQCHPPPEGFEGAPTPEGMFEIYRGLERSVVLKRLVPGVRYSVRVKAINCIGESPFSPVATFATQATVPAAPAQPVVTAAGEDSVVLRWPPVAGNGAEVTGYQVMMDDGAGGEFNFVGHARELTFAVAGLRSGLTYRFRVQAENSEGRSLWSPVGEARTAATAPQAPPPPARDTATHSSIRVTWQAPEYDGGAAVQRYEVEMAPKCVAAKRDMADEWVRVYEGAEPACMLGALRAGCTYRVRVRAVNYVGSGPYSIPSDVATTAANPEAPPAPTAAARAQDALTVAWDAPAHDGGATIMSYRLQYRLSGPLEAREGATSLDEPLAFQTAYDGPERRAEVPGLEPGMRYEFKVAASNRQGSSPWSNVATLATRAGLPLTPVPPALADTPAARALNVRWERPYGQGAPVNSYVVQMKAAVAAAAVEVLPNGVIPPAVLPPSASESDLSEAGKTAGHPEENGNGVPVNGTAAPEDDAYLTVYHGSDCCCAVADLEPNTEYLFRVRAFNSMGASAWSSCAPARTAPAAPAVPRGLDCPEATRSTVTLAWESPEFDYGAPITAYQLEFASAGRGQRSAEKAAWRSVYKGPALCFEVDGLRPGRQYRARVRAQNSCGWGPWTEAASAATHPDVPGPPEAPVAGGRTSNSVRVSWAPPAENNGAAVAEYELQMATGSSESDNTFSSVMSGLATDWKAAQLAPSTQYAFRVRAVNAVGAGAWSPVTTVTTSALPPLEPTAVAAELAEGGALVVSWAAPEVDSLRAGCTGYEIECAPAKPPVPQRGGKHGAVAVKQTCSAKQTQLKVTGLKYGGEWTVKVRAVGQDGAGHGAWSAPVVVTLPGAAAPTDAAASTRRTSIDSDVVSVQSRRRARSVSVDASVISTGDESDDPEGKAVADVAKALKIKHMGPIERFSNWVGMSEGFLLGLVIGTVGVPFLFKYSKVWGAIAVLVIGLTYFLGSQIRDAWYRVFPPLSEQERKKQRRKDKKKKKS